MLVSAASIVGILYWRVPVPEAPERNEEAEKIPAALERRLARLARFAPSSEANVPGSPDSFADQDWIEHTTDGRGQRPRRLCDSYVLAQRFCQTSSASGAWHRRLGPARTGQRHQRHEQRLPRPIRLQRGNGELLGPHDPCGHLAGLRRRRMQALDSQFQRRCLVHPKRLGGGQSGDGERTKVRGGSISQASSRVTTSRRLSSIRTTQQFRTIWAGTGEPNACGSGCEAGVGIYVSTNGGRTWKGPLGVDSVRRPCRRVDRSQTRKLGHDLRGLWSRGQRGLEHLLRRRRCAHSWRTALRHVAIARSRRHMGTGEPGRADAVHGGDA